MTQGVVIPKSQTLDHEAPNATGPALSVGASIAGRMMQTRWYDKQGQPHTEMLFVVGDVVYRDKDGERWAAGLQVLSDKLSHQVLEQAKSADLEHLRAQLAALGVKTSGTLQAMGDIDVMADEVDADATTPTE